MVTTARVGGVQVRLMSNDHERLSAAVRLLKDCLGERARFSGEPVANHKGPGCRAYGAILIEAEVGHEG